MVLLSLYSRAWLRGSPRSFFLQPGCRQIQIEERPGKGHAQRPRKHLASGVMCKTTTPAMGAASLIYRRIFALSTRCRRRRNWSGVWRGSLGWRWWSRRRRALLARAGQEAYPTYFATSATQPRLLENGRPVVGLQAVNLGRSKNVVLALDTSRSMAGSISAGRWSSRLRVTVIGPLPRSGQISIKPAPVLQRGKRLPRALLPSL